MVGCQYIGPDQDPLKHHPIKYCGAQSLEGKSYCGDHYWVVYRKGSATAGRRQEKEIEKEIEQLKLQQEIEEMENE